MRTINKTLGIWIHDTQLHENQFSIHFLNALLKYHQFKEIHWFVNSDQREALVSSWQSLFNEPITHPSIHIFSSNLLINYLKKYKYTAFYCSDLNFKSLSAIRNYHSKNLFPITCYYQSHRDIHLYQYRDWISSSIKQCDAIICHSQQQKKHIQYLLSLASEAILNDYGIKASYKGQIEICPTGIEPINIKNNNLSTILNLPTNKKIITYLEHNQSNIQPLLLAINELVEQLNFEDFLLVIAFNDKNYDTSITYSIKKRIHELNIEPNIHLEFEVNDEKKQQLLQATDLVLSLSNDISYYEFSIVLQSMYLSKYIIVPKPSTQLELLNQYPFYYTVSSYQVAQSEPFLSTYILHPNKMQMINHHSTAFDLSQLASTLFNALLSMHQMPHNRKKLKANMENNYLWPSIINRYHNIIIHLNKINKSSNIQHNFATFCTQTTNASLLTDKQYLLTTSRGLQVLTQTESVFYLEDLNEWLDSSIIYEILEICTQTKTIEQLKKKFIRIDSISFIIGWMIKYQLLTPSQNIKNKPLKFIINNDDKTNNNNTSRHLLLISKQLNICLHIATTIFHPWFKDNSKLLKNTQKTITSDLSQAVIQAIGWFSEKNKITQYHEIMNLLNTKGNIEYLIYTYPNWYRNQKRLIIRFLRQRKTLLQRFNKDISEINQVFKYQWNQPCRQIINIQNISISKENDILLLHLDNNQKIIYKARDLRIDQALFSHQGTIVNLINQKSKSIQIATHQILCFYDQSNDRHYGYTEYLTTKYYDFSFQEALAYHKNIGGLIAYCQLLGIADIHPKNIILNKELVHIIDAKTTGHRRVLQYFLQEVEYPEIALSRGIMDSSFEQTDLYQLWQSSKNTTINYNAFVLKKDKIILQPPIKHHKKNNQLFTISGKLLTDMDLPLKKQLIETLNIGYSELIHTIIRYQTIFIKNLDSISHYTVRYQPHISSAKIQKMIMDIFRFSVLQTLPIKTYKKHINYYSKKICHIATLEQRWQDPLWKEPLKKLHPAIYFSLCSLKFPIFNMVLAKKSITLSHTLHDVSLSNYFPNKSNKIIKEIIQKLNEEEKRKTFLSANKKMLTYWFINELIS